VNVQKNLRTTFSARDDIQNTMTVWPPPSLTIVYFREIINRASPLSVVIGLADNLRKAYRTFSYGYLYIVFCFSVYYYYYYISRFRRFLFFCEFSTPAKWVSRIRTARDVCARAYNRRRRSKHSEREREKEREKKIRRDLFRTLINHDWLMINVSYLFGEASVGGRTVLCGRTGYIGTREIPIYI